MLSFFSPRIAAKIGPLILLIFFGMLIFGYCYVWLFIPETKGLSLEEVRHTQCATSVPTQTLLQVDEMYRSGVRPWQSSSWRPSEKHIHENAVTDVSEIKEEKGDKDSDEAF